MNDLTPADAKAWATYHQIVRTGADTFMDVVQALRQINARRLYRAEFSSFEAYVNETLGWSKSKAYRLMTVLAYDDTADQPEPHAEPEAEPEKVSHGGTDVTQINTEQAEPVKGEIVFDPEPINTAEASRPQEPTSYEEPDDDALEQAQVDHDSAELHRQLFISLKSRWSNWNHGDGAFFVVVGKVVAQAKKELRS